MIEFVIVFGFVGGWLIMILMFFLMFGFGKMWGLVGVLIFVGFILIN